MADPSPLTTPSTGLPMFTDWLADAGDGQQNNDATIGLADLVKAVQLQRKKGKLVIEVEVAPIGQSGRQVEARVSVDVKLPRELLNSTKFIAGPAPERTR
jgi:hypothetical protein